MKTSISLYLADAKVPCIDLMAVDTTISIGNEQSITIGSIADPFMEANN